MVFTQGVEERKEYLTASGKCPQWFCGKCGSAIGTDLRVLMKKMGVEDRFSINVSLFPFSDSLNNGPCLMRDVVENAEGL
jgi:hypothetical protein